MTFDTLEELLVYKAELKAALRARIKGASYSIGSAGTSRSFTRASIAELRSELAAVEADEAEMRGQSRSRMAFITPMKNGNF